MQEVLAVADVGTRVVERQAVVHAERVRGDRADLGDRNRGGFVEVLEVALVIVAREVGIIGTEGVDRRGQHGHRVGVAREALDETQHAFAQGRVLGEQA